MHSIETGNVFRILDQRIEIASTDASGRWCEHLGHCPEYTVIRRSIKGTDGMCVGAEMILDARLVPAASITAHALRQASTFLTDQRPFYFQTLYVPADRIALEF